jgi:hypothetical protein
VVHFAEERRRPADAKVQQDVSLALEANVVRLEVAVDEVAAVNESERRSDVVQEVGGLEGAAGRPRLVERERQAPLDEERLLRVVEEEVRLDDVGVLLPDPDEQVLDGYPVPAVVRDREPGSTTVASVGVTDNAPWRRL